MIEMLALLAVATVIVLGWIYGSLFVSVFLTISAVIVGLVAGQTNGDVGPAIMFALLVIWLPHIYWRAYPRH